MSNHFITSLVAGAALFFLLHVGIWRAIPDNLPRVSLLGLLVLVGIGTSLGLDLALGGSVLELWAVAWTGLALGASYIIFYTVLSRSVSVTLLVRVLKGGSRPAPVNDLVAGYTASTRFEDRIRLMHESGLIRLSDDTVTLTNRGDRLARWSKRLGRILGNGLEG